MLPRRASLSLATSLSVWACLYVAVRTGTYSPDLARADIFGGLLISSIAGFVTRLLSNDPGNTGATVGRAIVNLQKDLGGVGNALRDFVGEMRGWLGGLVGLLKAFKDNALIPMLRWLREKIVWLKTWLKRIFGPTIEFLLKVRKKLLELYAKYVRPILDMIDIARFFLRTLDRLGVKWAGELERRLGQVETAITTNFQKLLGALNQVINVIDSVITLELLFQRIPFLRTLRRDLLQVSRLLINSRDIQYEPSPGKATPSFEKVGENMTAAILHGGGPYAATIREMELIWRQHLGVK